MKRLISGILLITSSIAVAGHDHSKIIYGKDDRKEVYEVQDQAIKELSQSVAVMVKSKNIRPHLFNWKKKAIKGKTLKNQIEACAGERFAEQQAPGFCTGFLVGDKYLVTAGHCVSSQTDCSKFKWVFDYKVNGNKSGGNSSGAINVAKSSVYNCKRVIESSEGKHDYALIELDKSVVGRKPLKFRRSGSPAIGTEILVIGHPMGLPMKVAAGAEIRKFTHDLKFNTNLDTYGGNSGSPVFNAQDGVVEGILVDGATDFTTDYTNNCRRSNRVSNDRADEGVSSILQIKALQNLVQE